MLVGQDFDKIQFEFNGLILSEPNVFLTDMLMVLVCIIAVVKLKYFRDKSIVLSYWYKFFVIYGISSFLGGLGHLFYEHLSIWGKIPSWITAVYSIFLIEMAIIKDLEDKKKQALLQKLAILKMFLVFIAICLICLFLPFEQKPSLPFLPIAFNTIIGVLSSVGLFGLIASVKRNKGYKYYYVGVLIMLPSAIFFLFKINIHPWLDKNDVSHILLSIGLLYFLKGVLQTQIKSNERS